MIAFLWWEISFLQLFVIMLEWGDILCQNLSLWRLKSEFMVNINIKLIIFWVLDTIIIVRFVLKLLKWSLFLTNKLLSILSLFNYDSSLIISFFKLVFIAFSFIYSSLLVYLNLLSSVDILTISNSIRSLFSRFVKGRVQILVLLQGLLR